MGQRQSRPQLVPSERRGAPAVAAGRGRDALCPAELWVSLEEHQDALELIMSKYRKQMLQLLEGRKREEAEPVLKVHQSNSGVRWDGDRRVLLLAVMQSLFPFLQCLCSKIHFLQFLSLFAGIFPSVPFRAHRLSQLSQRTLKGTIPSQTGGGFFFQPMVTSLG